MFSRACAKRAYAVWKAGGKFTFCPDPETCHDAALPLRLQQTAATGAISLIFKQWRQVMTLFSPLAIGSLQLQNRIVIPPMCQYSGANGLPGPWHAMHYGHLAVSGAGLLILEATAVDPAGRISEFDLGLWSDEAETALAALVRGIRSLASIPLVVQLAHAGRKASQSAPWQGGSNIPVARGGWQTLAPSPVAFEAADQPPVALDGAGIDHVVEAFAKAAARAGNIGFDCVEMHAAHGYLLHQFLSPLSNQRQDEYGGSPENRMRLPLRVFEAIRAAFPKDRPVGVRISATDWVDGGCGLEDSVQLTKELQKRGCAYIHVSGGGLSVAQRIPVGPGYQVPFAEAIKKATGLPTIAVGLITSGAQAQAILAEGKADLVSIGRAMLYDPRWPWHAAAELGAQIDAPRQYWRSAPHGVKNLFRQ
jgi:2,4-dienoyl-CoA reductase-like NADH-dependent reductase (Old Yellow Enzyme family)